MQIKRRKLFLILTAVTVFLLLASAILTPVLINREKDNWNKTLIEKTSLFSSMIQQLFDAKTNELMKISNQLSKQIKSYESKSVNEREVFFKNILAEKNKLLTIQIYDELNGLVAWNENSFIDSIGFNESKLFLGQSSFTHGKLYTYLSTIDTLSFNRNKYYIIVATPIQKWYLLHLSGSGTESVIDSLSQVLKTDLEIDFNYNAGIVKDGRKYSFPILNNYRNKIGVATFSKPSLSVHLSEFQQKADLFQRICLILIAVFIGFAFKHKVVRIKNGSLRFLIIFVYVIAIRVLFFVSEIPSGLFHNSLTDASNFSSRFVLGIVRSPFELFLTAATLLGIALYGYKLSINYFNRSQEKVRGSSLKFISSLIISSFLVLLLWRGFGASIKSVIFDSTLRYFKEFTLIASPVVWLMSLNILIIGLIVFLSALVLLINSYALQSFTSLKNQKIIFGGIFLFIQITGWIFDIVQNEPQGTPLIRVVFFSILFIILYQITFQKREIVYRVFLYSITASIISVSLLTHYNSELEKESLKITAYDVTRINEEQVNFILAQSLLQAANNNQIKTAVESSKNRTAIAFIVWSNSLLYREKIVSNVEVYDKDKKLISEFNTFDEGNEAQPKMYNLQDEPYKIIKTNSAFEDRTQLTGYVRVQNEDETIGFIRINVLWSEDILFNMEIPSILSPERAGILSAIDFEKLKIYDLHTESHYAHTGSQALPDSIVRKIIYGKYNSSGEAWFEVNINDQKHLLFALKYNGGEPRILVVGREIKNFTWNLSDFFKIFFIHFIIIILVLIILAILKYRREKFAVTFRTKLLSVFFIISIIPLFIVAAYIRNLTEVKNKDLLFNVLSEKTTQVQNYISTYAVKSSLNLNGVFEKCAEDLNVNFSIYHSRSLSFSSKDILYNAGLISGQLNPEAELELIIKNGDSKICSEQIENIRMNTLFRKMSIDNSTYVIEVNDLYNKIELPLSDVELDIFLFGIFSFAIVVIIVIGTFLSGQISSPIKKLTRATRAVATGDLSVEVDIKQKGEVKELADGFNMMVNKIRQSQLDIAQFEREEAWKEMAKQVAHEIKNPLTPMKLSVQQLITAYNDKSPKFDSIFEKVTSTVIAQVEILRNIASEFSRFARMPRLTIEKVNVVPLVKEALNLFYDERRKIDFRSDTNEIIINADVDHLKRTIVNLVRNSLQASATNISIEIFADQNNSMIRVTDNGSGIPDEFKPQVFVENFTTKKSGMGLGLSMAKKFIESIQGSIIIENSSASGTTFLITIPRAQ